MASQEKKVDVLILGAGLSGLASAYQLSKKVPSLTFLVAEANDRVGGRTLTMHVKGPQGQRDAFDLGAHWVCRRQKDIMSLIEELGGIEYYPQNVSGNVILFVYSVSCSSFLLLCTLGQKSAIYPKITF